MSDKQLNHYKQRVESLAGKNKDLREAMSLAGLTIEALRKALPKWLPIKSAPNSGHFLAITKMPYKTLPYIVYYSHLTNQWESNGEKTTFTHWQPLPE